MSSFYGGKQGVSFVIKDRFKYISREDQAYKNALNVINKDETTDDNAKQASIKELDKQTMLVQFANPEYKQCWYGEYIIIDSDNKNSRNNGKVYRRTLKGHGNLNWASGGDQTDDNCAEYIGQITGPAGDTPLIHLGSLKDTQDAFETKTKVFGAESYYLDNSGHISSANYSTDGQIEISSLNNKNVAVPGADAATGLADPTKYKDSIKWQWVNIRMPDQVRTNTAGEFVDDYGNTLNHETLKWKDTHVYVGLEIPYSVFNFTAEEANYMVKASISRVLEDDEKINKNDENETPDSHPYYYHEHLIIPRGIDGSTISNIRLRTANDFSVGGNTKKDTLYDGIPVYHADGAERYTISPIEEADLKEYIKGDYTGPFNFKDTDDSWKNVEFWVYDFSWYSKEPVEIIDNGEGKKPTYIYETKWTIYLGSYEEIKNASIDDEGTINIQYNIHNESWDKKLKWIEGLNFSEDGTVTLTMNNDKNIAASNEVIHSGKNWTWANLLTWITGMTVNVDKTSSTYGLVSINFNNNETQDNISKYLPLPKEIVFDKSTGKITLKVVKDQSSTYDLTTIGTIEYPNELSLVGDLDSTNTSTYDADRHIQYHTNTSSNLIPIGSPINYIQDVVLPTGDDDFHLYVLYNDPTHRPKIVEETKVEYKGQTLESPAAIITPIKVVENNVSKQIASEISITMTGTYTDNGVEKTQEIKTHWKNNIQGSDGTTFSDKVFWQDFGSLKTIQTGGLIAGEITPNKDYWPQNTDQYNKDTFEGWDNVLKQLNWESEGQQQQPENIPQLAAGHLFIYSESGVDKIWYGVNNAKPPAGAKNCTGQILIARIPDETDDSKISTHYFAYDFINKGWKDLGGIDANNGAGGTIVQGTDFSENSTTKIDSSLKKGLFFLSTEYTITNTPTWLNSTPWE